jgi:hypothetical protein
MSQLLCSAPLSSTYNPRYLMVSALGPLDGT